jgi:hypothetical protein
MFFVYDFKRKMIIGAVRLVLAQILQGCSNVNWYCGGVAKLSEPVLVKNVDCLYHSNVFQLTMEFQINTRKMLVWNQTYSLNEHFIDFVSETWPVMKVDAIEIQKIFNSNGVPIFITPRSVATKAGIHPDIVDELEDPNAKNEAEAIATFGGDHPPASKAPDDPTTDVRSNLQGLFSKCRQNKKRGTPIQTRSYVILPAAEFESSRRYFTIHGIS